MGKCQWSELTNIPCEKNAVQGLFHPDYNRVFNTCEEHSDDLTRALMHKGPLIPKPERASDGIS